MWWKIEAGRSLLGRRYHIPSNGDVAVALATLLFATVAIAATGRVLDALPFCAAISTIAAGYG